MSLNAFPVRSNATVFAAVSFTNDAGCLGQAIAAPQRQRVLDLTASRPGIERGAQVQSATRGGQDPPGPMVQNVTGRVTFHRQPQSPLAANVMARVSGGPTVRAMRRSTFFGSARMKLHLWLFKELNNNRRRNDIRAIVAVT